MRRASVALSRVTVLAALTAGLARTAEAARAVLMPGVLDTHERARLRVGGQGKGKGRTPRSPGGAARRRWKRRRRTGGGQ